MATKNGFELIITIVDTGFTDLVMDAAREVGARGGTIIHARGTGNKEIEKKYNISISSDKEIVLILARKEIKDAIMLAINNAVGVSKDGRGICFTIPVNDVAGIKLPVSVDEIAGGNAIPKEKEEDKKE